MSIGGMAFTIDGRIFDPQPNDQIVPLGSAEEWTVTNPSPWRTRSIFMCGRSPSWPLATPPQPPQSWHSCADPPAATAAKNEQGS